MNIQLSALQKYFLVLVSLLASSFSVMASQPNVIVILTDDQGYATDIWFDETIHFISQNQQKPFFVYLSLNAAHSPLNVPEKYTQPYLNNPDIPARRAKFYGMLANVDENLHKLRNTLAQLQLDKNTIILFLNDNDNDNGTGLRGPPSVAMRMDGR